MRSSAILRLVSLLLPVILLSACKALMANEESQPHAMMSVADLKPGQPTAPRALSEIGKLPCPGKLFNGDHPVMVVYFFKDGYVDVSDACPGSRAYARTPASGEPGGELDFECGIDDPCDLRKALRAVEYFTDGEDPCYRVNIGGRWYYRCY
jgi:hypothetical protein